MNITLLLCLSCTCTCTSHAPSLLPSYLIGMHAWNLLPKTWDSAQNCSHSLLYVCTRVHVCVCTHIMCMCVHVSKKVWMSTYIHIHIVSELRTGVYLTLSIFLLPLPFFPSFSYQHTWNLVLGQCLELLSLLGVCIICVYMCAYKYRISTLYMYYI